VIGYERCVKGVLEDVEGAGGVCNTIVNIEITISLELAIR